MNLTDHGGQPVGSFTPPTPHDSSMLHPHYHSPGAIHSSPSHSHDGDRDRHIVLSEGKDGDKKEEKDSHDPHHSQLHPHCSTQPPLLKTSSSEHPPSIVLSPMAPSTPTTSSPSLPPRTIVLRTDHTHHVAPPTTAHQ